MSAPAGQPHRSAVKETLVSIIIAFALAFVFRAFVIEAFVIPTGSMAPTLMGAHMRFTGPATGATWPVGPWDFVGDPRSAVPRPVQGTERPIEVHDPMSRDLLQKRSVPSRSGDRILVFKYLYSIYNPARWDVVVFKSPTTPQTNFIKRLIGLPGEQIALVDGDVFVRTPPEDDAGSVTDLWAREGWTIARKPERVQRAVWQPVYDSRYAPVGSSTFNPPWKGATPGWSISGSGYAFAGGGEVAATLLWDNTVRPITDRYPYNETPARAREFAASDLRMRCGVEPSAAGLRVDAVIGTRSTEFMARMVGDQAALFTRVKGTDRQGAEADWVRVGGGTIPPLAPGRIANIQFWHADQALQLWIDGERVVYGEYDWTPAVRVRRATGLGVNEIVGEESGSRLNPLADPDLYKQPVVRWAFSGESGPTPAFRLHAVGLDRDLYYQPANYHLSRTPAAATHPVTTPTLSRDHFFVCGDNSPQSEDGRLWGDPDPWVAHSIDAAPSVVPRDLLIGKAFFVYFPSLLRETRGGIPVPDFGRMRFIW